MTAHGGGRAVDCRFGDDTPGGPELLSVALDGAPLSPVRTALLRYALRLPTPASLPGDPREEAHLPAARLAYVLQQLVNGLALVSLSIHQDFVHPDASERRAHITHTEKCIDLAARLGIPVRSLEVEIHADYDVRGELGADDSVRPGYKKIRYVVSVDSDASQSEISDWLDTADRYSSWLDDLANPVPMEREVKIVSASPA